MRICKLLVALLFLPTVALAQYRTAPNNYYPDSYYGATFTGVVVKTHEDLISLEYTDGDKKESFTGRFETGCSVPTADRSDRKMMPADIPEGTVLTAFYVARKKNADGKKVKENAIIAIAFDVWQGQKISEDEKTIYFCTKSRHRRFRAF